MVASHDHDPVAVLSLAVRSENGMHAFLILDWAEICGCVERGAQAPLKEVEGWWAAEGLGLLPWGVGLAALADSAARRSPFQSGPGARWRRLPVLLVPSAGKIADWR